MNDQERFADLWTDYLEGELDERGLKELHELLASDERFVQRAADLLQTHRLLGLVVADSPPQRDAFVRETLAQLPESQDEFVAQVMSQVGARQTDVEPAGKTSPRSRPVASHFAVVVAALILVVGSLFVFQPKGQAPVTVQGKYPPVTTVGVRHARLASSSHAKFFGELSPPVNAVLPPYREYVLMSGLIEVLFPTGASAILEGPAVFHVSSDESLDLSVGRCSVHVPEGAEGFHVNTPVTRVVDRGTRFSVNVDEMSETEVQVIEGAADIYDVERVVDASDSGSPNAIELLERLAGGEAKKYVSAGLVATEQVPFRATSYRSQLPDRVVSYETTFAVDGGAEHLTSVTVQRGGKVNRFPVDSLIPARLTWFQATEPRPFLCGEPTYPSSRVEALLDESLVTGVINPDGSVDPLTTDPVLEGDSGTPGMAIRFDQPVVNGPGADVLVFDLQTFGNPLDGDAFHISPLKFREGLKSYTIRKYDLTMESPEAKVLTDFHVHFFAEPAKSLAELNSLKMTPRQQSNKFRGLAVGIDLSDLGYASGETIEGLFIQDALDDSHFVDPVFIAGLPEEE
ncbi:FecR domain-containing protein [Rhodopirellula sp. P2]|uniref:FecR domain-containing protein n=1 Tax=Rhodopirellula sp. P2 TaxID=2127060 RepID=UPI002367D28A|nr:FecR domain-containing protein [Rhodopirellula sp. P2]WDQ17637.1 FecR domain-containing protein [Rhodopirellula sp. P2]